MGIMEKRADVVSIDTGLTNDKLKRIASHLSAALADTMLLMIKSQVYHWNVVGPMFKPIHDLTEEHYTNLFEAADDIAERIRALGHPAPLSFTDLTARTSLSEETQVTSAREMVEQLVADHETIVRKLRVAGEYAELADDFVSHDLIVGRMDFHEKAIWMLRATIAD
ncbi:MAG: DNA starvation/stationary phase protection protein [Pseudomonadota bacterium]